MAFQYTVRGMFSSMYEYRLPQFASTLYLCLPLTKTLYIALGEDHNKFLVRADLIQVSSCVGLSKPQAMRTVILNRRPDCLHSFEFKSSESQLRKVLNVSRNRTTFKAYHPSMTPFLAIFKTSVPITSWVLMLWTQPMYTYREQGTLHLVRSV